MTGPVEWAALVFIVSLMITTVGIAWRARGILSDLEIKIAVKHAEFEKDIRHTKSNVAQHAVIGEEMRADIIRLQAETARLSKIVNGKH